MSSFFHIRITAAALVFLTLTGCASVDKKKASPVLGKGSDMKAAGVVAYGSGDYAGAQAIFVEALRLDRSVDNREGELLDLINLARLSLVTGDNVSARSWLSDAIYLAKALNDDKGLSEAYATLAKADYLSGNPDDALRHIDAALAIDAKSGARLNLRAAALVAAGRHVQAVPVLKEALSLNLDAGDASETANSYRALAGASLAEGSDGAALDYYKKAYEVGRDSGNSARLVGDLLAISALEIKTGRSADALFSLNRLYAVASASGRMEEAVFALDRFISVNEAVGNTEKAVFYRNLKTDLLKTKAEAEAEDGSR